MHETDGCSDGEAGGEDHDGWRGKMLYSEMPGEAK